MNGKLEAYLEFKGNAREALEFYAKIFESPQPEFTLFHDMPEEDQKESRKFMPSVGDDWVMNGSVKIGESVLMASDSSDELSPDGRIISGNNFWLSFSSEDGEAVRKVWDHFLEEGGEILMPLEETFWAKQYGALRDRFGIQSMIMEYIR